MVKSSKCDSERAFATDSIIGTQKVYTTSRCSSIPEVNRKWCGLIQYSICSNERMHLSLICFNAYPSLANEWKLNLLQIMDTPNKQIDSLVTMRMHKTRWQENIFTFFTASGQMLVHLSTICF